MVAKLGNYILKETLGKGSYSEVKLAVHEVTGEEFAIKVMGRQALQSKHFEEEVKNEIRALQAAKHPNVVNIRKVLLSNKSVYIVMEIVKGGELFDKIVGAGRLSTPVARKYFQQIVDAVFYCHLQGVCHRDLKPENILLDDQDNVKITDFGLSKIVQFSEDEGEGNGNHLVYTRCGTPRYMAPELLRRAKDGYCGFKADIWSLGIILFAMLSGYLPFNGKNDDDLYNTVSTREVYFPEFIPTEVRPLINRLLEKDPNARIPLREVREHPWFTIDYVEDENVLQAKDRLREKCECKVGEHANAAEDEKKEAEGTPAEEENDQQAENVPAKEKRKPPQLNVPPTQATVPNGLKSPIVQRIMSPTGKEHNASFDQASDLTTSQSNLVNKVATVLTPRAKFMPAFLKGGESQREKNAEDPRSSSDLQGKRKPSNRFQKAPKPSMDTAEAKVKPRIFSELKAALSPKGSNAEEKINE